MKNLFVLIGIVFVMLYQLSCSPDEEQIQSENPLASELITGLNAAPLLGDVVLENMYEAEARQLRDKTPVQIVTVLEGTSRVVLQARFRGVRDFGFGFPLYECELMDESAEAMGGIAKGMSGSPVGPPGRILGALAYGNNFSRAPTRFWVTAIDAMEAAIDHQTFGDVLVQEPAPAAPGINVTYAPVKTPMMITGIQPHQLQEVSSYLADSRYNFVELFADIGGVPAAPPVGTASKLAAGDMIGVATVTGDIVNVIGFGTVTQIYDNKFVAFGHPMFGDGKSALPVYRAVVNGIVPNLSASHKSTSAYGNPIGTITKDLTPAIVGELGAPPPMIPVKISYSPANNDTVIEKHHRVAYGQEKLIGLVAGMTILPFRMEINNATVDGTVMLHFQETDTVYSESFRSASSVVPTDIASNVDQIVGSFVNTLSNSAGKATLKSVSISITDKPQVAKAEIAEVLAPEEIVPGESVTVSITLVPHWSTAGAERAIQREVTLEVPADFPAGEANINVAGDLGLIDPPPDEIPDSGFGEEAEKPVPTNLDELIKQLEEDQVDPGLIRVTLSPSGFGDFSGLPPGLELLEGFLPPGLELLEGFLPPGEGEMPVDGFPVPEDLEPPEPIEVELVLDGFIVTGSRNATVMIKGEDIGEGMPPMAGEAPIEPGEEE